jgi:multisubunit Na+/H+ antiporter MnhG subunit
MINLLRQHPASGRTEPPSPRGPEPGELPAIAAYSFSFAVIGQLLGFGVLVPLAFFAPRVAIVIWLVLLPTGIASALIRRVAHLSASQRAKGRERDARAANR